MTGGIRLTPQVALVGSGEIGLSEACDSHVYLVDAGGPLVMVDAGAGIAPERIEANIRSLGYTPEQITHLLLTHGHADHAGGAAHFSAQYPSLRVCAGRLTASFLGAGDEHAIALDAARSAGVYPPDYRLRPVAVAHALRDGERLQIGGCTVQVIETPGHSADSVCYRVAFADGAALFCGDTLFASGLVPLLNTHDSDLAAYRRSLESLAAREVDGLYPGHGLFMVGGGSAAIRQQHERLQGSIYLPPVLNG